MADGDGGAGEGERSVWGCGCGETAEDPSLHIASAVKGSYGHGSASVFAVGALDRPGSQPSEGRFATDFEWGC